MHQQEKIIKFLVEATIGYISKNLKSELNSIRAKKKLQHKNSVCLPILPRNKLMLCKNNTNCERDTLYKKYKISQKSLQHVNLIVKYSMFLVA